MTTTITAIVLIVVGVGLVAIDIPLALNDVSGDTISEVLRYAGRRVPVIPYAWGVLGGHFWAGVDTGMGPWVELRITLWSLWVVGILSIWWYYNDYQLGPWSGVGVILVGILVGCFLWSQA